MYATHPRRHYDFLKQTKHTVIIDKAYVCTYIKYVWGYPRENGGFMTLSRNILVACLCGAISCAPVLASNCDSEMYRRYNPDLCSRVNNTPDSKMSFATAATITGGAAALIGGTIALLGASGGNSGSDNNTSSTNVQPTLPTYTMVGADVDNVSLASIIGTDEYATNANSYDDIRVAYSLARGYTGKNSNIAVFDSGISSWQIGRASCRERV